MRLDCYDISSDQTLNKKNPGFWPGVFYLMPSNDLLGFAPFCAHPAGALKRVQIGKTADLSHGALGSDKYGYQILNKKTPAKRPGFSLFDAWQ